MKKILFTAIIALFTLSSGYAQGPQGGGPGKPIQVRRTYRVFANNEIDSVLIVERNKSLEQRGVRSRGAFLSELGTAVAKSYGTALVQRTINASSNLLGLGVSYLSAWIYKDRNDRESWLKAARQQCQFSRNLATDTYIDDFYYEPSTSGAMDPMNMKFNGFGCKSYYQPEGNMGKKPGAKHEGNDTTKEILEFYVSCSVDHDSLGSSHMANHSKFYVKLDQLIFDTRHSCLPNDSAANAPLQKFDFDKRKNLTFRLNVKVFSSWINEAIMLTDNQQIGEFNIIAKIDREDLNSDSIFIYDKNKHAGKVSVTGDCFLVPRSYTGTADAPSWGTGQYRLEMTVYETCEVNEEWYKIPEVGNGKEISFAQTMGRTKWDKKKWREEWNQMTARRKGQSVWRNIWQSVTTAYVDHDWVQELVSPFANSLMDTEGVHLNKLLEINSAGSQAPRSATSAMPSGGQSNGGQSPGGQMPPAGAKP